MLSALSWLSLAPLALASPSVPPESVVADPPTVVATAPALEAAPQLLAQQRRPLDVVRPQEIRALPGNLDSIPVFNSNSPELVQSDGILLSTFPPEGMAVPEAHLNFPFEGRFDIFAHHVVRGLTPDDRRTLFMGTVVYNPSEQPVTLNIYQGVSYLSQEAPFNNLPSYVANPDGTVFAGPGSRTVTDMLQGRHQTQWPQQVEIPPQRAYLLMNAPIPLRRLPFPVGAILSPGAVLPSRAAYETGLFFASTTLQSSVGGNLTGAIAQAVPPAIAALPSNGRSALLYLSSSGPVYVANLSMYAPRNSRGEERAPTLQEWLSLLVNRGVAGPRDIAPSNPATHQPDRDGRFFYGRVAGVARGSRWTAIATDANQSTLQIPSPGQAVSYVLSTVDRNTLGTRQIQSAEMLVRYPDTAFRAHGNYGIHYNVVMPLYNPEDEDRIIVLKLQTPLQDEDARNRLRFLNPPEDRIFFRGTVRVRFATNLLGRMQSRYIHVVQRRGQEGEPLLELRVPPRSQRLVEVDLIYPPDATPPQVITVKTLPPRTNSADLSSPAEGTVAMVSDRPLAIAPLSNTLKPLNLATLPRGVQGLLEGTPTLGAEEE